MLHVFTDEKWTNSVVKQFIDSGEPNQEFVIIFQAYHQDVLYLVLLMTFLGSL